MTPLSDDGKNRRIAEFLEPNPDMNLKCWVLTPPMIASSGILPKEWRQPRDFANDPAMVLMLMEKLLEMSGLCFSKWISGPPNFTCLRGSWDDGLFVTLEGGYTCELKLGDVIRDAFIQAKALDK